MKIQKLFAILFITVAAQNIFAGDSGCGLGSMIIKSNTKLLQLFAVTTNHSFGSQTLGITFGTSGCSANGLVQNDKQIQYYVEINQEDIIREMSQGHGEKLATLAMLHGCSEKKDISHFSESAQSQFNHIVTHADISAVDFVNNLKSASIADACPRS